MREEPDFPALIGAVGAITPFYETAKRGRRKHPIGFAPPSPKKAKPSPKKTKGKK